MTVKEVPLKYINMTWPMIEGHIESALRYADGEITLAEVKTYLIQGIWSLYVVVDEEERIQGSATIHYYNRTDNRIAFVTAIGGKLVTTPELFSQLGDILRANGATCVEGAVRDSLVRLWSRIGARKKSNLIQIKL